MIDWTYLTDVCAAQLVFLGGYYLFLDRLLMGRFKRGYLLLTLAISFLIPVLPINPGTASEPMIAATIPAVEPLTGEPVSLPTLANPASAASGDWFPTLLWMVYLTGVLVGTLRLLAFMRGVVSRLRQGTRHCQDGFTEIVLDDATPPHTFLRWVFHGRAAAVAPAVLVHEAAHARQLHSVDRLLVAALRIVWWWNPLLLLYERAVAANHELLADREVVDSGYPVTDYQRLLLRALRPAARTPYLASPASFSFTKKRFSMMLSPRPSRLRRFLHLGIVAALGVTAALFFGGSSVAASAVTTVTPESEATLVPVQAETSAIPSDTVPPPVTDFWEVVKPARPNPPSAATLAEWSDPSRYGVWIDGKRVANRELANYSAEDFAHYYQSRLEKNAKNYGEHVYQIDVSTLGYFKKHNVIFPDGTYEPKGRPAPSESPGTGLNLTIFNERLLRLAGAKPNGRSGEGC